MADPPCDPDMGVRLCARHQPGEATRRDGADRPASPRPRGSGPGRCRRCGAAPSSMLQASGKPQSGTRPPGRREVDLVLGQPQEDPGVGAQVAEQVDLVVPLPRAPRCAVAGCSVSTTSMAKSCVQGWPSKRAPRTAPYSGQVWLASVAECTPRTRRSPCCHASRDSSFCSGDQGVSPMVKRARTRAEASWRGERSRTSVTTVGESPARPASSVSPVAAWARTPWTPAGPSA